MDPISQAALGAVVAQVAGHKKLGYKAALVGAAAGALPDIDVLFSVGGDFVDQLITHRGITHSLFFAPVLGPVLGWLIWTRERARNPDTDISRRNAWMLVVTLALLSHPLLDLLTPYGTQLLLPFTNTRFAINAMPIIDPIYTLLLCSGLLLAWLPGKRRAVSPQLVGLTTLILSSSYLGYGWLQNVNTEAAAREQLAAAGIDTVRVSAFPTILQVHLRRVVARSAGVDRVGFYSTWAPCTITWNEAARPAPATYQAFLATREGRVFDWFAMGWAHYDIVPAEGISAGRAVLTASDLRYGFDEDPLRSIFSVTAELDSEGAVASAVNAGRSVPQDSNRAFDRLLANTYAPACRIFNRGAIPDPIDENDES